MKKVKHILCPIDFSGTANNACRYALWLADHFEAKVTLLHVAYPATATMDFPAMATEMILERVEVAKELMKTTGQTIMAQVDAAYDFKSVPNVQSDVEVGVPSNVIARVAREADDIDLIVMGTHGEHNAFERTLGSVTTATLRKAPCPVLVIPEHVMATRPKTIGYASSLLATDPYHIWSTMRLLNAFNPILRVVHIQGKSQEATAVEMQELEDFFQENVSARQMTFHQITGKKTEALLEDFVDTWDIEILVMYKPNRTLLDRIFHTSLTKEAALNIRVPLLIIK